MGASYASTQYGWSCHGSGTFHCTTLIPTSLQKFVERLADSQSDTQAGPSWPFGMSGGKSIRTSWVFLLSDLGHVNLCHCCNFYNSKACPCVMWHFPQALCAVLIERWLAQHELLARVAWLYPHAECHLLPAFTKIELGIAGH